MPGIRVTTLPVPIERQQPPRLTPASIGFTEEVRKKW
jgi:hypothetical protein